MFFLFGAIRGPGAVHDRGAICDRDSIFSSSTKTTKSNDPIHKRIIRLQTSQMQRQKIPVQKKIRQPISMRRLPIIYCNNGRHNDEKRDCHGDCNYPMN